MNIKFEKIIPSNRQINDLYDLLKKREFGISHELLPSYEKHKEFVLKNPYKYWYFVFLDKSKIGTFYIMSNNSVGINLITHNKESLIIILDYINKNFSPEKAILSKVPNYFYVNISDKNNVMKELFKSLEIPLIQLTYKI